MTDVGATHSKVAPDDRSVVGHFDTTFAAAYRAAFRLLGERQDALECAQEALTRAYPKWERLAREGDPLPWVVRVAVNLATDRWRKGKFADRYVAQRRADEQSAAADAGLVDRLTLHRALATLPRRQREVVLMRYLADLSEATVAAALDISVGSVKQHAARGLAALRLAMQE